jgi:hypothetical protein
MGMGCFDNRLRPHFSNSLLPVKEKIIEKPVLPNSADNRLND